MKTVAILIGIQGSGKSEFYKRFLSANYAHINLDTLHTRNKENIEIEKQISLGNNMAVDNTNVTVAEREKYITIAKEHGYKVVGYFLESKLKECIARNNNRLGKEKIPSMAIAATSNKMQIPDYNEGFDELFFVKNDGREMKIEKWREI